MVGLPGQRTLVDLQIIALYYNAIGGKKIAYKNNNNKELLENLE